jgi:hypothetical protein
MMVVVILSLQLCALQILCVKMVKLLQSPLVTVAILAFATQTAVLHFSAHLMVKILCLSPEFLVIVVKMNVDAMQCRVHRLFVTLTRSLILLQVSLATAVLMLASAILALARLFHVLLLEKNLNL